ncbi:MAG: ribose-5-phosphate isomerase [Candidatus Staskawiczbacteria bacterium RIFCSPHIGHO2_02_FULL_34_10]|uniref:Ribose-5-phosphate isomerase n=1 Tax=Candidatus Staskawiczbacteria bacterium RIFCSPHIGHO2_02_FULL_34_10 TaxID=1802205 RepID=A0A1G2HVV1_9BACT|nr:MAG: ribose-5-phosphate isomerase [Candidatus Staskawiczbacteria bacterium RIFCSPHIGHO2_02_FULL_34_10]
MKIFIATDHRGYSLKEKIKTWLSDWNYEFEDFGAFTLNPDDDYPDFIAKVAEAVSVDPKSSVGIVLGGSGQGEAIVANKYKEVRAVVYYGGPEDIIKLSREHNDANVLSLGASFLDEKNIKGIIKLWLETKFSGDERHIRRINKIELK